MRDQRIFTRHVQINIEERERSHEGAPTNFIFAGPTFSGAELTANEPVIVESV